MDQNELDQQSQHWEKNFSNKPEMFGLEPSLSAKKSLEIFKKNKIKNILELGAGLGRDTIFFAQNSIQVHALDYSPSGIKVIKEKSNLLGDGVNIAARLEALAQTNGVTISKNIYDLVKTKTSYSYNDLGIQKIKKNEFLRRVNFFHSRGPF